MYLLYIKVMFKNFFQKSILEGIKMKIINKGTRTGAENYIYKVLGRWRQTSVKNEIEKNKIISFNQHCAQEYGI